MIVFVFYVKEYICVQKKIINGLKFGSNVLLITLYSMCYVSFIQGLNNFFKKEATYKERTTFFQHTFPVIISHALQIGSRKPDGGLQFSKQQSSQYLASQKI